MPLPPHLLLRLAPMMMSHGSFMRGFREGANDPLDHIANVSPLANVINAGVEGGPMGALKSVSPVGSLIGGK